MSPTLSTEAAGGVVKFAANPNWELKGKALERQKKGRTQDMHELKVLKKVEKKASRANLENGMLKTAVMMGVVEVLKNSHVRK